MLTTTTSGPSLGGADEAEMAFMKIAHGRNKSDRYAFGFHIGRASSRIPATAVIIFIGLSPRFFLAKARATSGLR